MIFIKINDTWWEVADKPRNYHGGIYPTIECKNWHELYERTHYNPLSGLAQDDDLWISPDGELFDGAGHAAMAEEIVDLVYEIDPATVNAEYVLEQYGWVKLSLNFWTYHIQDKISWKMTRAQANQVWDWCYYHDIEYPAELIDICNY